MPYELRWMKVAEIGSGGQGEVSRVVDTKVWGTEGQHRIFLQQFLRRLTLQNPNPSTFEHDFDSFKLELFMMLKSMEKSNHYALKVLHKPNNGQSSDVAAERLRREIDAMSMLSHRNLLKILDHSADEGWYVSPFYSRGSLDKSTEIFAGKFEKSLVAIRPLVAGVAEVHKNKMVHRDIKPQNVFVDETGELVLGDFGLVFFTDSTHTRVSDTFENVGSRDWMPAWAIRMRIEEVKPSFDVFCLGKLLWSMTSGQPFLNLWYFLHDKFNVEKLFPNSPHIECANPLFSKCIVERPEDCLPDASALLSEIDTVLERISLNADLCERKNNPKCKMCGSGHYVIRSEPKGQDLASFGLSNYNSARYRIYSCDNCGNVQFFHLGYPDAESFWKKT